MSLLSDLFGDLFATEGEKSYNEHLDWMEVNDYHGKRTLFITNKDKFFDTQDYFYDNDVLTINEFNYIVSGYNAKVISLKSNYPSEDTIVADVDFGDRMFNDNVLSGNRKCFSHKNDARDDDLTIEKNFQIRTQKLYCVSILSKSFENKDTFWDKQCVTIPEMNYILAHHNALIKNIIPNYRTKTEFYILVEFSDNSVPSEEYSLLNIEGEVQEPPRTVLQALLRDAPPKEMIYNAKYHQQIFCTTSLKRNDHTKFIYFYNNFISMKGYNNLISIDGCAVSEKVVVSRLKLNANGEEFTSDITFGYVYFG